MPNIKRYTHIASIKYDEPELIRIYDTGGDTVLYDDIKHLLNTSDNNNCTVTHPSDASPKCLNKLLDSGDYFIKYLKEHQGSDLYRKLFKHFVQS